MTEYAELQRRLAQGWNTWNTRSVLSHVLLPEGLALNLAIKEYSNGSYLKEALIGRQGEDDECVRPGPRTYDGRYTELHVEWMGISATVQSATEGEDLVLLVTPHTTQRRTPLLVVEPGVLWNRPGYVVRDGNKVFGHLPDRTVCVYTTAEPASDPYVSTQSGYLAVPLGSPIGVTTGRQRGLQEIQAMLDSGRAQQRAKGAAFGGLADTYAAIQTCLAWDTVYDPLHSRVVSPVSRIWSCRAGGYRLFCWDNYFAAYLASIDNRDLAYANAIEITREMSDRGFVPNFATATGSKSLDRSQPPIGSLVVRELYRRFRDRWLLDELFDDLLTWNRWWVEHRSHDGLLRWGSDPYEPLVGNYWESTGVGERFGAALESGLDNSPMYDDVPFDARLHQMELADVGLNSLYISDCSALAELAMVLGRRDDAAELSARAFAYSGTLSSLWNEEKGIYLNRRTDTGEFSDHLSPTSFYPLLAGVPTQAQAERMISQHFYSPEEFWGDWIMPSIARNDRSYADQDYWRGRIWAPMNLLVYLGMRRYDLPQARMDLAEGSSRLLLKEWHEHGHIHENYNANTGDGCDSRRSDRFYHWGGLLGIPSLLEKGFIDGPEEPLGDI